MKSQSKDTHDADYYSHADLVRESENHALKTQNSKRGVSSRWNSLYKEDDQHGFVMDNNPHLQSLVDIGSGTRWFVNYANLVRKYKTIYGIEPSTYAMEIAKKIYGTNPTVNYINDYAEDALPKIELSEPTLFTTFIVLSHLEDEIASNILREMNKIAPKGSVMYFNEMHGETLHDHLWHCRDKEWWQKYLDGWELTFHTESKNFSGSNRFKGISGTKK